MKMVITIDVPSDDRYYQKTVATILQMHALQLLGEPHPVIGDMTAGDVKLHYHVTFEEE